MELQIKDYKNPFSLYSKKYSTPKIWEKLFRTGYLWREYDTKELQEYMQILSGHRPTRRTILSFIEESERYEKVLSLKKRGKKTYNPSEL